ncbi:hypothetical protein D3C76_642700 [compost metagenome]
MCFGITVVVAGAIFPFQALDTWGPYQFERHYRTLGAAAAELETIARFKVGRVLLEDADLCVQLRGKVVAHAQGPLADWPVVPDATHPVAHLRAAEGQVLEVAREAVEVLAFAETAEFHVQCAIEVLLLDPHLRQPPGFATAPYLLGRGEAADTRVVDAVVADVVAVALGDGQLEFGVVPAKDLLQVQVAAEGELVAVARGAVVVVATMQVAAHLAGVAEGEVVAFFQQFAAGATPVAEHPRGVAGEHFAGAGGGCQGTEGEADVTGFRQLEHEIALSFDY